MISPRAPVYLSHSPTPKVAHFAVLSALEAGVRGMMISVMPLTIYRAFGDAVVVSRIYLFVGILSLLFGLLVPFLSRFVPRRWIMTFGGLCYLTGLTLVMTGVPALAAAGLFVNACGTVSISISLSAYVLDYIHRNDLGRNETMRMVYSALPWAAGPVLGVWLMNWWFPAPFLVAGGFAAALIATFWYFRLGNGKQITMARGPTPNPLAFVGGFLSQPRLVAGWLFAVLRSCGWWVYVVYLPIYCIQSGLGDSVGAIALSVSNGLLFLTPVFLRFIKRLGVRNSVRLGFAISGGLFVAGWLFAPLPWVAYGLLMAASVMLVWLDVSASLPFLMAVKPSQRTEMAAVFSSYRDASGILTPAAAWLVLLVSPVAGVFAACGAGLLVAFAIAGRLHPRLGRDRKQPQR